MNLSLLTTPSSGGTPPAFPIVRMMCLADLVFALFSEKAEEARRGQRASIMETGEAQRGGLGILSRGPGRLQRQVLQRLEAAPGRSLSRRALEEIFVAGAGYGASNLLRAIRSLDRMRYVSLHDGPDLDRSHVSLPRLVEPMSDDEIFALLTQATDAKAGR
jgi:hypothetical protein